MASDGVYVDASALVKAVIVERESTAFREYVAAISQRLVSSRVVAVEGVRAARLAGGPAGAAAMAKMLEYVVLVALTDAIVARASSLDPAELRALDAIHLATAVDAGIADMLVYDHRLAAAARTHGLAVVSPGA